MKPALTPDQRRAIETSGVDLCVVAGAGTGKTRVLTERVVHRVMNERADLRKMLAITFTEKAAAEMKSRLVKALADAGRTTAREDVESAAISTIHAFCARLLREHAVEAGVDPAFRVLDEVQCETRRREALDALVEEMSASAPDEFAALSQLPGEDPGATLLDVWSLARESGRGLAEFLATPPELSARGDFLASIRDDVDQAFEAAMGAAAGTQQKAKAAKTAFAAFPADDAPPETLGAAVVALRNSFTLQVTPAVKPWLANVRASCDALLSVLAEESLVPVRARLARAVERLETLYESAKGGGRELDFVDLERRAVALLSSNPAVTASVRERWTEVLVDEFQDVNPLQARLIDLVRSPRGLFVVGDPKQSIYGFRGSDVEVFTARRAEVVAADATGEVTLSASFRSRTEVLGVVNRLFRDDFDLGVPLSAGRTFPPRATPCAELHLIDADNAVDGREAEAAWIADRIVALVEGPHALRLADPTDDEPLRTRPATFGDVAVLSRTMSNVKMLERALTARDVPYAIRKGRGFFEAREVVDLANLLAVIDNPRDDLVFAAVLRSPACGLSDDGLFALCSARGDGRLLADVIPGFDAAALPERDRAAFVRFRETWSELRSMRASETVAALVDRALTATGLETLVLARPNGRQRAANLRKVRARARAAEGDLRAFVTEIRDLREREVRETEAPASGGAAGAVSLMTVHAAKGLEFGIVFVPDLAREEGGVRSPVVSHAREGLGFKGHFDGGPFEDVKPWAFARIEEANAARELAEAARLFYVACTRAEEHLVLSTSLTQRGGKERPWWTRTSGALGLADGAKSGVVEPGVLVHERAAAAVADRPGTRTLFHRVAQELADGTFTGAVDAESAADASRLVAESSRVLPPVDGSLFSATVSGLVAFARCPQEFRLRHIVGAPESLAGAIGVEESVAEAAPPSPGDDDEWGVPVSARALGRAVHLALERLVPEFRADIETTVRDAISAETGGAPPSPADVKRLAGWVRGFQDSDIGREVQRLPRDAVRREQAMLFAAGRTVVRGQMDLAFRGAGGWTVVDYKAGGVGVLRDDYILQMRLYSHGLAAITNEPPGRLVLFALPEARAVEVPCSPADAASLSERLVPEFLARTKAADYRPRAEPPCEACAYRRRCSFAR